MRGYRCCSVVVVAVEPPASVVDVYDSALAADGDPSVAAERGAVALVSASFLAASITSQCQYRNPDRALVRPPSHHPLLPNTPLHNLAALACNAQPLSITPPVEIRHAASSLHARFRNPLTSPGVEDVDRASALAPGPDETHPAAAGGEFEALHGALVVGVAVDAGDFLDSARGEVPGVEVAATGGEEDF